MLQQTVAYLLAKLTLLVLFVFFLVLFCLLLVPFGLYVQLILFVLPVTACVLK